MTKGGAAFLFIRNLDPPLHYSMLGHKRNFFLPHRHHNQAAAQPTCFDLSISTDSMVPSQSSSAADARNAILENGFFFVHDALLGQLIEKMDKDGIPFASAGGLQFCKTNVLDNPVSKD